MTNYKAFNARIEPFDTQIVIFYGESTGRSFIFCDFRAKDGANCYKLIHTGKLWDMINTVTREHLYISPRCTGNLNFDTAHAEQRGLAWRERAVCDKCNYCSSMYNLYEEIATEKRGRRSATSNVGFNIAMTQTPAAATSVHKMFLGGNITAPSMRGMYKCASKVSGLIEKCNKADMKDRRQELKKLNRWRNLPENQIPVQSDGMYNNSLYSGVGRTPFQPATQCTYIVAENITQQKQIISMATPNKLCSKHGFHTQDEKSCDNKSASCTATEPMETNIGDEKAWAKKCFEELNEDGLEISFITTDPDTKAYQAAEDLYESNATATKPQYQIDTRHLSQNHRKCVRNNVHVLNMMPGSTRKYRQYLRNRFAIDIARRCQSEFDSIHRQVDGRYNELVSKVHKIIPAIKKCYCGDHGQCILFSNVCSGATFNNWIKSSCYLPSNFKINGSQREHDQTLLECIEYRLSDDMLELTRLNTNSQKVEATNRSIKRSLPKNVTFTRNFCGRAHSAVHSINNGPGESIKKLCKLAGCPIPPGGKVAKGLQALQDICEKQKSRQKSLCRKIQRQKRRTRMFKLYEKHQEQKNYMKNQLLRRVRNACASARRRIVKKSSPTDHIYHRNPANNQLVRRKRQAGLCSPQHEPLTTQ